MNNQAAIQLACSFSSAIFGLYLLYQVTKNKIKKSNEDKSRARPCIASLQLLWQHGIWTLTESAVRNVLYLWLMNGFDATLGDDGKLAWGTFRAIRERGSILMVPLQTLEASTLTYVGHAWGQWRGKSPEVEKQKLDEQKSSEQAPDAQTPYQQDPNEQTSYQQDPDERKSEQKQPKDKRKEFKGKSDSKCPRTCADPRKKSLGLLGFPAYWPRSLRLFFTSACPSGAREHFHFISQNLKWLQQWCNGCGE